MTRIHHWLSTVAYLIQKEFRQTFRDRAMLRMIFMVPIIQLVVLSYAMTTDLKNLRIAVLDQDQTAASRELTESFFQNTAFRLADHVNNPRELQDYLQKGRAELSLWIPKGYAEDIAAQRSATVGIMVDGENSNAAGRAMGYAEAVIRQQAQRELDIRLLSNPTVQPHLVEPVARYFYNPELISQRYMVPAILVILITVITGMLTGMAVVREKEIGTLEQLMVTPLTSGQIIAGKLIPFAILGFIELAFASAVAVLWFNVPLEPASIPLFAGCALVYLMVTLGGGLLASTMSDTQQQAMLTVWFFLMFGIMTSGIFYPIENMPRWIYLMTYANPIRFFMAITRGIFLKSTTFMDILPDLIPLVAMGVIVFAIAVLRFQKRVA